MAAPSEQDMVAQANTIARQFAQHYYQTFDSNPPALAALYVSPPHPLHLVLLRARGIACPHLSAQQPNSFFCLEGKPHFGSQDIHLSCAVAHASFLAAHTRATQGFQEFFFTSDGAPAASSSAKACNPGLDPIQIRRSDILQSYWFLVRPLGPNFLRYATNSQLSQFSFQFMVFIFGHKKEERRF
jgi:hypothetical protein